MLSKLAILALLLLGFGVEAATPRSRVKVWARKNLGLTSKSAVMTKKISIPYAHGAELYLVVVPGSTQKSVRVWVAPRAEGRLVTHKSIDVFGSSLSVMLSKVSVGRGELSKAEDLSKGILALVSNGPHEVKCTPREAFINCKLALGAGTWKGQGLELMVNTTLKSAKLVASSVQ